MQPIRALRTAVLNVSASGASLIALAPIYVVFVNALKTQPEASSMGVELPVNPQWGNFGTVIDQGKLRDRLLQQRALLVRRDRARGLAVSRSPHMSWRGIGPGGTRSSTCC